MINKFERNVAALRELCSEIDEQNLKQISENVAERESFFYLGYMKLFG